MNAPQHSYNHGAFAGESGGLHFARSTSQAQGYYSAAEARQQPQQADAPAQEAVTFRRSHSEPQAVVQAEKTQEPGRGPVWRLKNAFFNPQNMVSTWMSLGFIKAWSDKTFGAWGMRSPIDQLAEKTGISDRMPKIPYMDKLSKLAYGKEFDKSKLLPSENTKPQKFFEKTLAAGITASLIQNMAFFMTARGGEIPEGDTVWQRAVNSVKNPDKHSVHFSNATISGFITLIAISRVGLGVQGLMKNPEDKKKSVALLVSGISGLVAAPLVFTGLFRMKKEAEPDTPQSAEEKQAQLEEEAAKMQSGKQEDGKDGAKSGKSLAASFKPSHLKDMWQYALKHDKMGLMGRALSIVVELGFVASGRVELDKNPASESAHKTVKGGLTGLVLTCMQMHFVYDRLLTNSQKDKAMAR